MIAHHVGSFNKACRQVFGSVRRQRKCGLLIRLRIKNQRYDFDFGRLRAEDPFFILG
jgi:hypothetical protein